MTVYAGHSDSAGQSPSPFFLDKILTLSRVNQKRDAGLDWSLWRKNPKVSDRVTGAGEGRKLELFRIMAAQAAVVWPDTDGVV